MTPPSIVGDKQVRSILIISVLEADKVFLLNSDTHNLRPPWTAMPLGYSASTNGVFDDQHKEAWAFILQIDSQALLVSLSESIFGVCAEFCVIGWVEEHKIIGLRGSWRRKSSKSRQESCVCSNCVNNSELEK